MANVHVHVNGAMSLDGKTASPDGSALHLSCAEDDERVHALRSKVDAVLVGVGTVLADDPHLTARPGGVLATAQPLRVVLDSRGRTPPTARVLDDAAPTLILAGLRDPAPLPGAEVRSCGDGRVDLQRALELLAKRGVRTLLVEGGGTVVASFLDADLVDLLTLYVAPMVVGGQGPSFAVPADRLKTHETRPLGLGLADASALGEGALLTFRRGSG